jgi:hypothetical protein
MQATPITATRQRRVQQLLRARLLAALARGGDRRGLHGAGTTSGVDTSD